MNPGPQRGASRPVDPSEGLGIGVSEGTLQFALILYLRVWSPQRLRTAAPRSQWVSWAWVVSQPWGLHTGYRLHEVAKWRTTSAPSPVGETVVSTEGCCTSSRPCGLTLQPDLLSPSQAPGGWDGQSRASPHPAAGLAPRASSTPPGCGSSVCRIPTEKPAQLPDLLSLAVTGL